MSGGLEKKPEGEQVFLGGDVYLRRGRSYKEWEGESGGGGKCVLLVSLSW